MPNSPMPILEIEALQKLTQRLNTPEPAYQAHLDAGVPEDFYANHSFWEGQQSVRKELESLIPQVEKTIADWKDIAKQSHEVTEEQQAELAALKEPMACGHPKACETFDGLIMDANSRVHRCAACAQQEKAVRLAVAAAHQRGGIDAIEGMLEMLGFGLPQGDEVIGLGYVRKALDAHDAEVKRQGAREMFELWTVKDNPVYFSTPEDWWNAVLTMKSGGSK